MRAIFYIVVALAFFGCDRTEVRVGPRTLTSLEPDAVRVLVSPDGIATLVEVANPDGLRLAYGSQTHTTAESTVVLGPLDHLLDVTSRTSESQSGSAVLTTRLAGDTLDLPARISWRGDTWVCRWRVTADEVETVARLVLLTTANGAEFGVAEEPTVSIVNPRVAPIDDCSEAAPALPPDFDDVLLDYLHNALGSSSATSLPSSPLDTIGLLRGNLRVIRLSPFDNRAGTLVLESDVSDRVDALSITPAGLAISMDATVEAGRARCAPPTTITAPIGSGAHSIDPSDFAPLGADFAVAVSSTWLARLAQGATLAGYSCSGLEDARHPLVNTELIPVEDLLLEHIGLNQVPLGAYGALVLVPGTLPTVQPRPDQGVIAVTWDDLQLEVYGEIAGARTRLARLVVDAQLGLRPTPQVVGDAKFSLESIEVTTDSIDSEFFETAPPQVALDRWARRTLLSVLEESFEFPLPLSPPVPVRTVGVEVREHDVVVLLRFE